ncbi:hypothetical protein ACJX0J_033598, partial [Zea mays]
LSYTLRVAACWGEGSAVADGKLQPREQSRHTEGGGTSTGQVRRHFSEEGAHQQGPRARLLRLRRLGARQAARREQQQPDDGARSRAPQAQAA